MHAVCCAPFLTRVLAKSSGSASLVLRKPGRAELVGTHRPANRVRVQAAMELRHCGEVLDEEQAQDEAMRGHHGDAWARPPSRVAAAAYRENIARYEANLAAAGESDARNARRLAAVQPRLSQLTPDAVRGLLPRLQAPMVSPGIDADDVTAKLRQIIAQLDALSQERAALEEDLRARRTGDDVLPALLRAGAGGEERVFAAHLDAFRQVEGPIEQNAARTNEALALLREYVAAFRRLYDVDGWQAECQRVGGAPCTSAPCCLRRSLHAAGRCAGRCRAIAS